MNTIVVTRHNALIEYLKKNNVVQGDVRVIEQATPDDVRGNHVIGVLPLHLAALAGKVTVVDLNVPAELRGVELSLEQIEKYARGISSYIVRVVDTNDVSDTYPPQSNV